MMRIALILLAVLIATPMAEAKGRRAAMSGDTIMLDGKIIKLKGLECPPMDTEEGKEAQRLVPIMLHARILHCAWDTLPDGTRRAFDTEVYTEPEIQRVARVAFELAQKHSNKVHSVEKANVMETGKFWREIVTELHEKEFSDVKLNHMYADNCAMQLVRFPKQFDVIVTDNLFGDMLSDEAAMLTGSLGLLPSASLGERDKNGRIRSLYEPVHGSAPDIAGKNISNPIATILSFSMALKHSFDLEKEAVLLDEAVQKVLDKGRVSKFFKRFQNFKSSTK